MTNPYKGITERPSDYYRLSYKEQRQIDKALPCQPVDWTRPVRVEEVKTRGFLSSSADTEGIEELCLVCVSRLPAHGYLHSVGPNVVDVHEGRDRRRRNHM